MTEQEILSLVNNVVSIRNAARVDTYDKTAYEQRKIPDYYQGYRKIVSDYRRILVHTKTDVFPDHLFLARSPNQTQQEFDYEKANYKQTTLPVFVDFVNTITRIFSDGNWSVYYNDFEDYQRYVEDSFSEYGNLEQFMRSVMPSIAITDPNGVIAVRPKDIAVIESEEGAIIDNSVLFAPQIFYYNCENVVAEKYNEYFLLQSNEKSLVRYGNSQVKKGLIYEFYDKNEVWIIEQVGSYGDFNFQAHLFFKHDTGELPAWRVKGNPEINEGKIIWQSPFRYACDSLDLVALNQSRLQVSTNASVYPYKVMIGTPCDFEVNDGGVVSSCSAGRIYNSLLTSYTKCPGCEGTGLKSRMSPMGVLLLNPVTREGEGDAKVSVEPLKYISPELTTLEFLREQCRIDEDRARNILHLKLTNTSAQGPQNLTATGDVLDMKSMYSFIAPVSHNIFSIYEKVLMATGLQRYGDKFIAPTLVYPVTFDFMTESDYLRQITDATTAGAPPLLIQAIMYRYLKALYYNEKTTADAFNLIYKADRLMAMSAVNISLGLSNGTINDWEVVLHDSAIFFVNNLYRLNEKFFEQEIETQIEQLIQEAKDKAEETRPETVDIAGELMKSIGA